MADAFGSEPQLTELEKLEKQFETLKKWDPENLLTFNTDDLTLKHYDNLKGKEVIFASDPNFSRQFPDFPEEKNQQKQSKARGENLNKKIANYLLYMMDRKEGNKLHNRTIYPHIANYQMIYLPTVWFIFKSDYREYYEAKKKELADQLEAAKNSQPSCSSTQPNQQKTQPSDNMNPPSNGSQIVPVVVSLVSPATTNADSPATPATPATSSIPPVQSVISPSISVPSPYTTYVLDSFIADGSLNLPESPPRPINRQPNNLSSQNSQPESATQKYINVIQQNNVQQNNVQISQSALQQQSTAVMGPPPMPAPPEQSRMVMLVPSPGPSVIQETMQNQQYNFRPQQPITTFRPQQPMTTFRSQQPMTTFRLQQPMPTSLSNAFATMQQQTTGACNQIVPRVYNMECNHSASLEDAQRKISKLEKENGELKNNLIAAQGEMLAMYKSNSNNTTVPIQNNHGTNMDTSMSNHVMSSNPYSFPN